jgi:hypothetical protein
VGISENGSLGARARLLSASIEMGDGFGGREVPGMDNEYDLLFRREDDGGREP